MEIRQAKPKDIEEIKAIIDSLQVSRQKQNWQTAECGFFEYPKSVEELKEALNPYFIVAKNSQVKGFSLSYDSRFAAEHYSEKPLTAFLLREFESDFLYIDMLGVSKPDTNTGRITGAKLTKRIIELAKNKGLTRIISSICEKPWTNKRSEKFTTRFGSRRFGSFSKGELKLGLYELKL